MHAEVTRRQDGQAWARRIFLFLYIISLLFTLYPGDGPPAHLSREGAGEGTRSSSSVFAQAMSPQELWSLREDAREAFYHGFDAYMAHGYPWDEVKPLSCLGRRWDKRERGTLDDPLGGYALTLVDSLDMLAIVGDYETFRRSVRTVVRDVSFDKDVVVSVFESTIRVLGGLLSAHLLAADPAYDIMPGYDGELLEMATDLAWRLVPAFNTSTGLPYHRVHLQKGVLPSEPSETCTAAAGTLVLEFGILSRLTNEPLFESLARRSLQSLWDRRSHMDLMGSNIDVHTGVWKNPYAAVGAGVDSFFEYLLKSYIVLDDPALLEMFVTARNAVNQHLLHANVHMETHMYAGYGGSRNPYVSSLQAFWPGLEALAGYPLNSTAQLRPLLQLWKRYSALPEMFDLATMSPVHFAKDAPLRPELVESLYIVYGVTRHPSLLSAAAEILKALNSYSKVKCGYASIADVSTKRLDDRMDSYFLSETTKYLFLLFDMSLMPNGHLPLYPNPKAPTESSFPWSDTAPLPSPQSLRANSSQCTLSECSLDPAAITIDTKVLTIRERLAVNVRNRRSTIPALPFDPSRALFTTEGHLVLLFGHTLDVYHTFHPKTSRGKSRRRKAHHVNETLTSADGLRAIPSQATCKLPIPGWSDRFVPFEATNHMISKALKESDITCPVPPDVDGEHLDVSSSGGLLRPILDSAVEKQIRMSGGATPQQQKSKQREATAKAQSGGKSPHSTAITANWDPDTSRYISSAWSSTGGVFSEVEFEYYLNEVSEALVSAGVSSVTLTCTDGTGCTAVMGVLPQSPYTLQLQSHSLTGPDGNPITFTFNSCIAHFGRTPTAAALGPGRLVVASPLSGCEPINIHAGNSNELGLHPNSPLFVLIGRGDCSFATKARHAQVAGAHGVIIVDFTPKQKQAPENILDPSSFSMSDDGTGSDISVVATAVSAHAVDVDTNLDLTFSCIVGLRPSSCKSAVKSSSVNGYCSCSATAMSAYEVSTSTTSKDNTVYTVDTVRVELTGGGESIQSGNTQSAISLVTTVLAKLTATTP